MSPIRRHSIENRWSLRMHVGLLTAAVLTYTFDRQDVVWRFVKACPHSRAWEHVCFGVAAAVLGLSAWLTLRMTLRLFREQGKHSVPIDARGHVAILQAVGIAALLPITGALLLITGEFVRVLLMTKTLHRQKFKQSTSRTAGLGALSQTIAPCCAFVSMLAFSITLADRLGEELFAGTALISLLVSNRGLIGPGSPLGGLTPED